MIVYENLTILPVLSQNLMFALWVRDLLRSTRFSSIIVDLPVCIEDDVNSAITKLPEIHTAIAIDNQTETLYYCPADPCDAMIEACRLGQSERIPVIFGGSSQVYEPLALPPLPDSYCAQKMGREAYAALVISMCKEIKVDDTLNSGVESLLKAFAKTQEGFRGKTLAIVHMRHIPYLYSLLNTPQASSNTSSLQSHQFLSHSCLAIHPDTLYFALGELPYITARAEANRQNVLAEPFLFTDAIRDIFSETRDQMLLSKEEIISMNLTRCACALTFLRNMTVAKGRFMPDIFDIITAASGVGGNRFALACLTMIKFYPYIDPVNTSVAIKVGTDSAKIAQGPVYKAVNLLRNHTLYWRTIDLKPDPSMGKKKEYRYTWNTSSMCSHLPEDRTIELFNAHVRSKTLQVVSNESARTEPFSASFKDGIDIRETLRHWYDGKIYVRENPPVRGRIDTVVIIFDDNHDELYPHRVCWYAEHKEESTLTFYGTDPFADLIGPGIARCTYGGLALLFPPRIVPSVFEIKPVHHFKKLSEKLLYGSCLFTEETTIAYVSAQRPSIRMRKVAHSMGRRIVWLPLTSFSSETIVKLRRFHILNGKQIRSFASRFISDF